MQNKDPKFRRNNFDVANTVNVTDPVSVADALETIFLDLFPDARVGTLRTAVNHVSQLYRGEHPAFAPCDTGYHDLQHIMDVTLASARLMDGYERSQKSGAGLGEELFIFGILLALFHDSGYLRKRGSEDDRKGAEFTLVHVSRSAELLKNYMQEIGMGKLADIAAQVVHFTGYEVPVERIQVPPAFRAIGNLVASADILAQMSDRCYLEKCYDRLYTEFVLAGIAKKHDAQGNEQVLFSSPQDLVIKTPGFYKTAKRRMEETLQGAYRYVEKHFKGQNLYLEEVEKNIQFAEYVIEHDADIGMLQRNPPKTPGSDQPSLETELREQQVEDRRKTIGDRRKNAATRYPDLMERRKNKEDRRQDPSKNK
ncbi:MAG TPA: hypothetical protein VMJ33_05995 [Gallionella sp.]|nr:hypothetical protein [Gallionella sp.]